MTVLDNPYIYFCHTCVQKIKGESTMTFNAYWYHSCMKWVWAHVLVRVHTWDSQICLGGNRAVTFIVSAWAQFQKDELPQFWLPLLPDSAISLLAGFPSFGPGPWLEGEVRLPHPEHYSSHFRRHHDIKNTVFFQGQPERESTCWGYLTSDLLGGVSSSYTQSLDEGRCNTAN